jgi:hypothetical protein
LTPLRWSEKPSGGMWCLCVYSFMAHRMVKATNDVIQFQLFKQSLKQYLQVPSISVQVPTMLLHVYKCIWHSAS